MKKIYFSLMAAALSLTACTSENNEPNSGSQEETGRNETPSPFTHVDLPEETRAVVNENNAFAVRLFQDILLNDTDNDNFVISPASAFSSLSMLANGDNGATKEKILEVLGYDKSDMTSLMDYCRTIQTIIPTLDNQCTYATANSVWHPENVILNSNFTELSKQWFNADMFNQDPGGESGMRLINNWVKEKTNGHMESLLESPLDDDGVAVLNALYFKGSWSDQFDPEANHVMSFNNQDGTTNKREFMHMNNTLPYIQSETLKGIRLNYGNGNFSFYALLPKEGVSVMEAVKNLSADDMMSFLNHHNYCDVTLDFPKFDSSFNGDILENLDRMGVASATGLGFDSLAEGAPAILRKLIHGVNLSVNETGSVASAASLGWLELGANVDAPNPEKIDITFDRPFIFLIQEKSTETILFMGCVKNL